MTNVGPAVSDIATTERTGVGALAWIIEGTDGSNHLAYSALPGGSPTLLTDESTYDESTPSFSPDGSAVVFARSASGSGGTSQGIWRVSTDGTGLTNLSTDGSYPTWIP
jgi:Tol biopolymer transport system component